MSVLPATGPLATQPHRPPRAVWIAVAIVAAAVIAVLGYGLGTSNGPHVKALSGDAYVGANQAAVKVDGWTYGIVGSVAWVDSRGASHDSGWPDCLGSPGTTVHIRFGEVSVTGPQDDSWRQVVWVDCRG
ncbi:MAG: hypothetical protein QOF95_2687 [Pseudonocardiales bacterium]|jgi:hypothetical protein|nr:hypothetical protein [Pseudonocardiales bacterium]